MIKRSMLIIKLKKVNLSVRSSNLAKGNKISSRLLRQKWVGRKKLRIIKYQCLCKLIINTQSPSSNSIQSIITKQTTNLPCSLLQAAATLTLIHPNAYLTSINSPQVFSRTFLIPGEAAGSHKHASMIIMDAGFWRVTPITLITNATATK